jgi:ferredoxin
MQYISRNNFIKLLNELKSDYEVYVPVKKGEQRFYKKYIEATDNIVIGEVRPFEPLKAFFVRAREKVADNFQTDIPHAADKPFCIVGVKNCDLKGFAVQDYVFTNHSIFKDPFYIKNREENFIISADCTCAIDTCFCLALGNQPHPESDFDINLAIVKDGFVVEVGSEKGQRLLDRCSSLFEQAEQSLITQKEKQRAKVVKEIEKNIQDNDIPRHNLFKGIIEDSYESGVWQDEAETCVECGGCTIICPACHCFLLYDQKDKQNMERLRVWDSCMLKNYARVAGGANPRPKLWMRLRNRFEKKFDFFPKVAGVYACTGCGRCVAACPAKIDIRKVLKKLVGNAKV